MNILIISPHLDDAILSLGGLLQLRKNSQDKVMTLCNTAWTALSDTMLPEEITKMNLEEELTIIKELGCQHLFCDFDEAMSRDYENWNDKFSYEKDSVLYEQITEVIKKEMESQYYEQVYFPLGIGEHVDHIMVYEGIRQLRDVIREQNVELYFYEDLPYATYGGVEERLEKVMKEYSITLQEHDITEYFERKCSLLSIYKSQLTDEDLDRIRRYVGKLFGGSVVRERVWKVEE